MAPCRHRHSRVISSPRGRRARFCDRMCVRSHAMRGRGKILSTPWVTKDYLLFKKIAASCSSYIISRYFITLCVRGLSESDRLLAATTLSFDIAALELFLPLVPGSSIV